MTKSRARVRIAGHDYSIGCAPGEEERITGLASELEAMMARLSDKLGDVGDRTLAVMAGLTALDRLAAAEAANARLRARLDALERAREEAALAIDHDDESLLMRLEMVTHTVDNLVGLINRDTRRASGMPPPEAPPRAGAVAGEPAARAKAPPAEAQTREEDAADADGNGDAPAAPIERSARPETALEPAGAAPSLAAETGPAPGRLDISPATAR